MTEPTPTVAYDSSADELFDGRYRLGRLLGRGGYARVYEAVDTALERTLAIKVIDGDGADPSDVARVRSEIRLLASLSHPSLVTLYDARLDATPAYLAMELIAGPTLTDVIARGRVAGPEAARVGREIAEAFAVIHGRGIVHRDVKPSNILLRPAAHTGETSRATLADFGIASLVGATRVTRADTVIGTAAYLSPEQARGMPAAPASDVYSLGLVLLEALTGSRPFGSRTPHEALAARLVSAPEIPAHIPAAWREVLERMTAVDPAERPDATGLIVAMRTLSNVPVAATGAEATARLPSARTSTAPTRVLGASGAHPTPASTARRRPSRRTVIVASVVAAVIAAGGVTAAVAAGGGGVAEPDLPSLPQPLDQHVDDLWKEVGQ
ncbi:serine/threonine-protein kinase [Microbacterium sp. KSW2-29]|uniref:non-specific serine/threonine protein kinase n=1 Tax=Microbacterium phycohabitans TaxID=3075993 RepID=A0ABU3SHJ7_9MICO|nr:serine/threonine-protein kinase [Microbacterium sp. KSW2-29]MDU0344273.1 serine/threonine-protein kinase [Microbacterium sp. KSW2-29]